VGQLLQRPPHATLSANTTGIGFGVDSWLGFRVINCSSRDITRWSAEEPAAFTALSYVWGDVENEPAFDGRTLPTQLPRTIEDAIEATLKLGYE